MPGRSTTCVTAVAAALLLHPGVAMGGPAVPPVPLPAPSGQIVHVSTLVQLQNAVASIASNTTILIGPGTYNLATPLYINGSFTNVGIRGATGKRDDVVLVGKGMNSANDGGVPFGIWVGGNVQGVTIAHLTIRDVYYHPIMLNAGAQSPLIHNVRLVNAGQQLLKSSPDGAGGGVDNGIVDTPCSSTTRRAVMTIRMAWTSTPATTGSSVTTCFGTFAPRRDSSRGRRS